MQKHRIRADRDPQPEKFHFQYNLICYQDIYELNKYLVTSHSWHIEEVLERVGGAEELGKGGLGVPVEGVAEVVVASRTHPSALSA